MNNNNAYSADVVNWQLDQVYEHLLKHVKPAIEILCQDEEHLHMCYKWLKILERTSVHEKMARNCLLNLMMDQLRAYGRLYLPFTNLKNCNLDLEKVLLEMTEFDGPKVETTAVDDKKEYMDIEFENNPAYGAFEILSVINEDTEPETLKSRQQLSSHTSSSAEKLEQLTMTNRLLRDEINAMQTNLDEQLHKNKHLERAYHKAQIIIESNTAKCSLGEVKLAILKHIRSYLTENNVLDVYDTKSLPIRAFESIFNELAEEDEEFAAMLCDFDSQFNKILSLRFKAEYKERKHALIRRSNVKFTEYKAKLKRKCEDRINFTNWQHLMQLKFIKLRCFTSLRKVFVNTYVGEESDMWEELGLLEQRYQHILNEIFQ